MSALESLLAGTSVKNEWQHSNVRLGCPDHNCEILKLQRTEISSLRSKNRRSNQVSWPLKTGKNSRRRLHQHQVLSSEGEIMSLKSNVTSGSWGLVQLAPFRRGCLWSHRWKTRRVMRGGTFSLSICVGSNVNTSRWHSWRFEVKIVAVSGAKRGTSCLDCLQFWNRSWEFGDDEVVQKLQLLHVPVSHLLGLMQFFQGFGKGARRRIERRLWWLHHWVSTCCCLVWSAQDALQVGDSSFEQSHFGPHGHWIAMPWCSSWRRHQLTTLDVMKNEWKKQRCCVLQLWLLSQHGSSVAVIFAYLIRYSGHKIYS